MYQRLWSKYYDTLMKDAERKGLQDWRQELLKDLFGNVLELGCGTGANLEFYPKNLKQLILTEPNHHMHSHIESKLSITQLENVEILADQAENLSFSDESFDYAVCTLVLCSVKNPQKALSEIHRVLKPQGKLIFIEHIAALNKPKRYQWQKCLEFLWKRLTDGCHLTRRTDQAITNGGFEICEIKHQSMRGVPPIVRPTIRGIAKKIDRQA